MKYFMEWEGMCINCDLHLNDRQLVDPSIFWTHSLCSESLSDVFIQAQWADPVHTLDRSHLATGNCSCSGYSNTNLVANSTNL